MSTAAPADAPSTFPARLLSEDTLGPEAAIVLRDALRDELRERLGDDTDAVLDYCEHRRPEDQTEIGALQHALKLLQAGSIRNVVLMARMEPALLERFRVIAREIVDALRVHTGLAWDDPMTIREVRRTVRRHLEGALKTARPVLVAELVERHVRFTGRQLVIESSAILTELFAAKAF